MRSITSLKSLCLPVAVFLVGALGLCAIPLPARAAPPAGAGSSLDGTGQGPNLRDRHAGVAGGLAAVIPDLGVSWGLASSSRWLGPALLAGLTVCVADEDGEIQQWVRSRQDKRVDLIARVGGTFGDGKYALPALCLLYSYGRLGGHARAMETARLGFESVVVSGAVVQALKFLSHKRRPSGGLSEDTVWGGPSFSGTNLSFPSGHSACAFAIGTVVAEEFGDNRLLPPLAYGAAALCAFSRVRTNAHYLSDVIVGSAIGYFTARAVLGRHGVPLGNNLSILPHASARTPGFTLSYSF
jgi:hypothetical protein